MHSFRHNTDTGRTDRPTDRIGKTVSRSACKKSKSSNQVKSNLYSLREDAK